MKRFLFALIFAAFAPVFARADEPAPAPTTTPTPAPVAVSITRDNFISLEAGASNDGATGSTLSVKSRRVTYSQLENTTNAPTTYTGKVKVKHLDTLLAALDKARFTTLAGTYKNDKARVPPQSAVLTLRTADGPRRFLVSADDGAAPPAFTQSWDAMRAFIRATVPASAYTRLLF